MSFTTLRLTILLPVLATLVFSSMAKAQQARPLSVYPSSAMPGTSNLKVTIVGGGFGAQTDIRFWISGTKDSEGVSVSGIQILGPEKFIATIEVAPTAAIADYDVDVSLGGGERLTGAKLFAVGAKQPGNAIFGCTGAEAWRRRVPCKRGTIY